MTVRMASRSRHVVAPSPDESTQEERTSLTGSVDGVEADTGSLKRKSAPAETGSKFKVVGTMVLAMQRFQGILTVLAVFCECLLFVIKSFLAINPPNPPPPPSLSAPFTLFACKMCSLSGLTAC